MLLDERNENLVRELTRLSQFRVGPNYNVLLDDAGIEFNFAGPPRQYGIRLTKTFNDKVAVAFAVENPQGTLTTHGNASRNVSTAPLYSRVANTLSPSIDNDLIPVATGTPRRRRRTETSSRPCSPRACSPRSAAPRRLLAP